MTQARDMAAPFGLRLYAAASRAAAPLARFALSQRIKQGKEDPDRVTERMGEPSRSRPDGFLFWIHGASVGESLSVLPLVRRLQEMRPDAHFLVTTGTVTSARLMKERLPDGAIHQFIPVDHPAFVDRFIEHWRPQAAIFVESEFWPNLILAARRRTSMLALVNGRVSPNSFDDWRKKPATIAYLLRQFDLMIAQDRQNAERLAALSKRSVDSFGNLKNAAAPLPVDDAALARIKQQIGARPVWLAASTHPGEDVFVFDTHRALAADFPNLLTIIAPRHPARGEDVRAQAMASGLNAQKRTTGGEIVPEAGVYVADTLGELGLFYRLANIAFVGGSLVEKGGHNPLEPARLGAAILHGPHVFNFVETYQGLRSAGGAALVRNERELATAVRRLLSDEKTRTAMTRAAASGAEASAERVLSRVADEIARNLKPDGIAA
jgi:3-deoxy-D-manno-octulosonic-acid transferase